MLFPDSSVSTAGGRRPAAERSRSFAVLPSVRQPRLLVPLAPRRAAAAALLGYGGRLRRVNRLAYRALGGALQVTGPAALRPRLAVSAAAGASTNDIDTYLAAVLNGPVAVAIHLTPARSNRKPIVQALGAGSRQPLAFAKVAGNDLTARLVDREATALKAVSAANLDGVTVPDVLDHGRLNDHAILVMRPLVTWSGGRAPTDAEQTRAAGQIARSGEVTTTTIAESAFWQRLVADIELVDAAPARDALRRTADQLESVAASVEIEVGVSHGDWTPWNMWQQPGSLLVWDWERFATDVPIGSDLVHFRLQELRVVEQTPPVEAARVAVAAAPRPIIGALHLLALAVRYDTDNQAAASRWVHPSDQWLLPVVDEVVAAMSRGPR
jgi:hypothetical protein